MEDTLNVLKFTRSAAKVSWGEDLSASELQAQIQLTCGACLRPSRVG